MSDSEGEFESADEGSNGDDGWEIENDFDLLDIESKTESISTLPNLIDKGKNDTHTNDGEKSLSQDHTDATPMIPLEKDKLRTSNENLNFKLYNPKKSDVLNETEPTSTQSSVSNLHILLIFNINNNIIKLLYVYIFCRLGEVGLVVGVLTH